MKARPLVLASILFLILLTFPVGSVEGASDEVEEGQHPIYIIKQVVETTSDWTQIEWIQSPDLIVPKYSILEGSDAPGLEMVKRGLSYWLHKEDTSKVVIEVEALAFRGDDTALVEVSRNNAGAAEGYVRSEFYVFNRTIGDFTKLGEVFLERGNYGPVSFEHDLSTLYDTPSATANVERAVKELDKKVLAFYYNWYSPSGDPSPGEWSEPVADVPLMGPYHSSDERVIQAQMAMAKNAGIDVLIADCYPPGSIQAENIPTVLRLAEENGLLVSTYSIVQPLTLATHPAWLRDAGRPVFFSWNPGRYDPSDWLEWRRELEESIGPVVWIGNTIDEEYLGVFDGFHSYICMPQFSGDNCSSYYRENIERMSIGPHKMDLDEAFSLAYSGGEVRLDLKSFSVSVIPGYDDTKIRSPGILTEREEGAVYERLWRTAIDLDAHSVLITSWNEWMEGTELEPSVEYGFDYINLTRGFIEEYKQTSITMPEADFSVGVDSLIQRPDLSGNGRIVISVGETPAIFINVSVSVEDGVSSLGFQGDFDSYVNITSENYVSMLIPSIPSNDELIVEVVYDAETFRPQFNISVTAFDPSGRLYELYEGQLRSVGLSSISGSLSSESFEIGGSIIVSGALNPENQDRVITLSYTRPDSSTVTRTVTTAVDGSYGSIYKPVIAGSWSVRASWQGDGEYEGSTSSVLHFTVAKKSSSVSIQASESHVTEEDSVTVSGSISPAVSEAQVLITFTKPDGSAFTSTISTGLDGSYSESYTSTQTGSWTVEASWEGDSTHMNSISETVSFTVVEPSPEPEPSPSPSPSPTPEPDPEPEKTPGGIPGFPIISVVMGVLAGVIMLGLQRSMMKSHNLL